MTLQKNRCSHYRLFKILTAVVLMIAVFSACDTTGSRQSDATGKPSLIPVINSREDLNKIIEASGSRLLMIDFYADWCPPCKELNPILEEIAKENRNKVVIYKVNIDTNKELAREYRVAGIPHVTFIKDKENLLSLSGLYPKKMYLKVIDRYAS